MNVAYRSDWKSGDAQVAGISRSPLIRLPMRSDFCRQSKNHELLAPSASDCAWSGWIAKDQRRRSRLEAECLAEFKPTADLSTYRRGKSVRTTRATAVAQCKFKKVFRIHAVHRGMARAPISHCSRSMQPVLSCAY